MRLPDISTLRRFSWLGVFAFLFHLNASAAQPVWILLAAPDLHPAMDELIAKRRSENYRVVVLDSALASDPEKATGAIKEAAGTEDGQVIVLLAGTSDPQAPGGVKLPAPRGTQGRMKKLPSDHGFSLGGSGGMPRAAVGRLPARSAEEVRGMATKIMAFEKPEGEAAWRTRITALIGHPGGGTPLERTLGANYVNSAVGTRIRSLHPRWRTQIMADVPGSPWLLEKPKLEQEFLKEVGAGTLFFLYMGHSGPSGLYSDGLSFMETPAWAKAGFPHGGVFFSCGCFSLSPQTARQEGHGFTAMRNSRGPAAVIGAVGESYSAAGQLAFDGLLTLLQKEEPPALLADCWLAAMKGLTSGKIDAISFGMLDMADGSGGKVPLDDQRKEHVEMWQLLGDPAMRLPVLPASVKLEVQDQAAPGGKISITGKIPPGGRNRVVLTVERPPGETAPGANHAAANNAVVETIRITAQDVSFSASATVPSDYTGESIILRAMVEDSGAMGVLRIKVQKP
ncbi:MAG TPA: C25 family cysteine peptidase [Verrucomicrobiales bacterium]|nr:C25 family cysteine peptidase [Verrucomicrobiales bacterium]